MPGNSLSSPYSGEPSSTRRGSDCRVGVASVSRGAAHSPAVWVLDDPLRTGEEEAGTVAAAAGDTWEGTDRADVEDDEVEWQRQLESEGRSRRDRVRQLQPLSQPWMVGAVEHHAASTAQAPSPRVLDNRLHSFVLPRSLSRDSKMSLSSRSAEATASAAASIPSHAARVSAPPAETTEDELSTSTASSSRQRHPAPSAAAAVATRARRTPQQVASASTHRAASAAQHRTQEVQDESPGSTQRTSSRSPSSASSASSSALSAAAKKTVLSPSSFKQSLRTSHPVSLDVDGLGPLMVVHLDVLPALGHARAASTTTPAGQHYSDLQSSAVGVAADMSPSTALVVHPDATAAESSVDDRGEPTAAVKALVVQEADGAHSREVAALYAKLEVAEQRARIAEQQVSAAAELRAGELLQSYKADERQRRAHFQTSLDTLREENRELTAQLEAAARAPAMGLRPSTSAAASVLPYAPLTAKRGEEAGSLALASGVDVVHQVQSVEAYWRERLRNAERHWEDEMTQQARQRREALDQVDELVRTVEQTQEELRYTRRQAARLREENVRLANAASPGGLSASGQLPSAAVSAEAVARLRQALKEHEHREAALLAQVESYGEEATQVRLRYEAALEKARQDVDAERRRSTEMVKLYGSQLESLHHQLRESKMAGAPR
ncbi:hypothetical protein ABB37_06130 [Leptomonas pyrrhocoris]|uniref:Uncharacterized protein n=1 Tax=Leptomonas pyrrhocoris TaxID=157538 RepID=A0A0N0VEP2_LEPPY|nr:hypothetical protein ABB37_06130 [Leptomonas pyrrhocoris]KPA78524.1 hypothetical protein ABB37_06130 [Leptomonas pyrrhocoris]|eukprot:XP_015656963.1 hypothetical protein ABB37_06130 [Leptomonas pyrrhocoris]